MSLWLTVLAQFRSRLQRYGYSTKSCFSDSKTIRNKNVKPSLRKQMIAKEVTDIFHSSQFVAVFHYNDVNCHDWNRIRNKLAKHQIRLKVVPARLTSKVLSVTKYTNIIPLFKGCTAIAFSNCHSSVPELLHVIKPEGKLFLLGGIFEDQLFTPQGFHDYAELPSQLTQHFTLLGTLTSLQALMQSHLYHHQQQLCTSIKQITEFK